MGDGLSPASFVTEVKAAQRESVADIGSKRYQASRVNINSKWVWLYRGLTLHVTITFGYLAG
jgi:hypothetical protein